MIEIIAGKYGPKLLGPGTKLNLDEAVEKRLVNGKVAIYINALKDNVLDDAEDDTEEPKVEIKSLEQLQKIRSKKELIQYAESVGLHDLLESDSKDSLVDAIANYLEENFEQE